MIIKKIKKNKGFVILYAVMISSMLLAIALGVTSISLKEIKFGTSAIDTNNAFFAADIGAECALYYNKSTSANRFIFPEPDPATSITCATTTVRPTFSGDANLWSYDFTIPNLGSSRQSCVKVVVLKNNRSAAVLTTITSKGYNIGDASCNSTNPNRVERQLELNF